jgi:hypothetical protein
MTIVSPIPRDVAHGFVIVKIKKGTVRHVI